MKVISPLLFLICGLILWNCNEPKQRDKPLIVCTTGFVGDAVSNITGQHATIITLMGAGVDPHTYKPSQGDMQNLLSADLIVYNGLHLEGNMATVLDKISQNKKTIAMGQGLSPSELIKVGDGVFDPHIWFDASLWAKAVKYTSQEITKALPQLTAAIQTRTPAYLDSVLAIHEQIKALISQIPPERRFLITSHDAFGYYGRAYGLKVKGLQGISTLSEPTLGDITSLVNLICENKIPAIFVETSVAKQAVMSVVEGCAAKGHFVKIGGELYSDALGKAGSPEGTYLGVILANTKLIVNSLIQIQ